MATFQERAMKKNGQACREVFLTIGATLFVALFVWKFPENSSEWAAWVQAFGSIGAILAAIQVVRVQHLLAERSCKEDQARQVDMLRVCVRSIVRQSYEAFEDLASAYEHRKPARYTEIRWKMRSALQMLEQVDFTKFDDRHWVSPILSLRALLNEGCERTEERMTMQHGLYVLLSGVDVSRMQGEARALFTRIDQLTELGTDTGERT